MPRLSRKRTMRQKKPRNMSKRRLNKKVSRRRVNRKKRSNRKSRKKRNSLSGGALNPKIKADLKKELRGIIEQSEKDAFKSKLEAVFKNDHDYIFKDV